MLDKAEQICEEFKDQKINMAKFRKMLWAELKQLYMVNTQSSSDDIDEDFEPKEVKRLNKGNVYVAMDPWNNEVFQVKGPAKKK